MLAGHAAEIRRLVLADLRRGREPELGQDLLELFGRELRRVTDFEVRARAREVAARTADVRQNLREQVCAIERRARNQAEVRDVQVGRQRLDLAVREFELVESFVEPRLELSLDERRRLRAERRGDLRCVRSPSVARAARS